MQRAEMNKTILVFMYTSGPPAVTLTWNGNKITQLHTRPRPHPRPVPALLILVLTPWTPLFYPLSLFFSLSLWPSLAIRATGSHGGERGGKKKKKKEEEERTGWLADRLVTSLFRDPERTARAGIHFVDRNHYPPLPPPFFFSLPPGFSICFFLASSPLLLSPVELRYRPAALKSYG